MQLSLDPSRDPHSVHITLTNDKLKQGMHLQVVVWNRANDVLSSLGLALLGEGEPELIPQMLHLMALNWLYLDATQVTRGPKGLLTEYRQDRQRLTSQG